MRQCPKCESENTHARSGALYRECWACDYVWTPDPYTTPMASAILNLPLRKQGGK